MTDGPGPELFLVICLCPLLSTRPTQIPFEPARYNHISQDGFHYHDDHNDRDRHVSPIGWIYTRVPAAIHVHVLTVPFSCSKQKATKAEPQFPDINTLRRAIPKHCFEPSAPRSLWYLLRDVVTIGALGWAAVTYIPTIDNAALRTVAWIVYGYVQGLIGTGLWILGHEGGHGAFSKYQKLNDAVGFFAHSALMVPYYSWKFSHHRHHMYTGNMEKDMAFVPATRADYMRKKASAMAEFLEDTPAYQFITLIFHQLFAWITYLLFNISSGKQSTQKKAGLFGQSHFDPTSAVFRPSEAPYIVLSDIGLAITATSLYYLSGVVGVQNVFLLYLQPYVWVHQWLSKLPLAYNGELCTR